MFHGVISVELSAMIHHLFTFVCCGILLLLGACTQEIITADNDALPDNTGEIDAEIPDTDTIDPRCTGWRRKGDVLWWHKPLCCFTQAEAVQQCDAISHAQVASIHELRSLVQDCPATALGGACRIGEATYSVLPYAEWSPVCRGCSKRTDGSYSQLVDKTWYWSRDRAENASNYFAPYDFYYTLDYPFASINAMQSDQKKGAVRCTLSVVDSYKKPPEERWELTCPEDTGTVNEEPDSYPNTDYGQCAEREEDVIIASPSVGNNTPLENHLTRYTYITGTLEFVADSPGDTDLRRLSNLRCIGGDFLFTFTATMTSLHGLENLKWVGRNIEISENKKLSDISALAGLTKVNGELTISANIGLNSLEGLHNIKTVDTFISIVMSDVKSLNGLRGLESAKTIGIDTESEITSLQGLNNLKTLGCGLSIQETGITSFAGLDNLESVGEGCSSVYDNKGFLEIINSPVTSLSGLKSLKRIFGKLAIVNVQDDVTNLEELAGLQGIKGRLILTGVNNVSSLHGLENITYLGGLTLFSMDKLTDITALSQINAIHGLVNIEENQSLQSLQGLNAVTRIDGPLIITKNTMLQDITALYSVDSLSGSYDYELTVTENPMLPSCQPEKIRSNLSAKGWSGPVTLSGNTGTGTCE